MFSTTPKSRKATKVEAVNLGTNWLRHCQQMHVECKRTSTFLPTRLVYISSSGQRLILSVSLARCPQYVTLSHCWGNLNILRLLKENGATLQKNIPYKRLCRTFQEAISIARSLRFEYLWIDSLCIVQDDPMDWRREAATMSSIYTYCALNIAATSAADGSQSWFVEEDPSYTAYHHVATNINLHPSKEEWAYIRQGLRKHDDVNKTLEDLYENVFTCVNSNFYTQNVINTPLGRRAWVVQERLLSPRILHFGRNQLLWVCQKQVACEAYPDHIPTHLISQDEHPDLSKPTAWTAIVSQYSGCSLTRSSDKLVAISELARKISENISDQYLAGLWLRNLHTELCWTAEKTERKTWSTSDEYWAPTWSWASLNRAVRFRAQQDSTGRHLMTVVKTEMKMVGDDPYGELESAAIWVKCFFPLNCVISSQRRDVQFHEFGRASVPMTITWDSAEGLDRRCYFLPVLQHVKSEEIHGLVLVATKIEGQYYRIGYFKATVEGWPYERLERASEDPACRAGHHDFVADFRDENGTLMKRVIMLI
jgi:hypothetical protein